MNKLTKTMLSSIAGVVALGASGAAQAHASFNGHSVLITWEEVYGPPLNMTLPLDVASVSASDSVNPDAVINDATPADKWDIDFLADTITLKYTGTDMHGYMYSPGGTLQHVYVHFQDAANNLLDIEGVTLLNPDPDNGGPLGSNNLIWDFDQGHVSFDANNIWVDLMDTMHHPHGMPGMPNTMGHDTISLGIAFHEHMPAPVPVPAALPLFLTGILGTGLLARRRRS
jgi:hypothetical protein